MQFHGGVGGEDGSEEKRQGGGDRYFQLRTAEHFAVRRNSPSATDQNVVNGFRHATGVGVPSNAVLGSVLKPGP